MRRFICLLLISALGASLLAMPGAAAGAGGGDAPLTVAKYNKKKCKKAKKKRNKRLQRKHCKKKDPENRDQVVRDDAGFTRALAGSKLSKTEEGSTGYGEYTWNFCAGGQWSYRSYYYAGSTVESNDGGSYQVLEGYHAANDPNYYAGLIQVTTSDGTPYRWGVELRGPEGYMLTKNSSFTEGTFTRTVGAAVC